MNVSGCMLKNFRIFNKLFAYFVQSPNNRTTCFNKVRLLLFTEIYLALIGIPSIFPRLCPTVPMLACQVPSYSGQGPAMVVPVVVIRVAMLVSAMVVPAVALRVVMVVMVSLGSCRH